MTNPSFAKSANVKTATANRLMVRKPLIFTDTIPVSVAVPKTIYVRRTAAVSLQQAA